MNIKQITNKIIKPISRHFCTFKNLLEDNFFYFILEINVWNEQKYLRHFQVLNK